MEQSYLVGRASRGKRVVRGKRKEPRGPLVCDTLEKAARGLSVCDTLAATAAAVLLPLTL